MRASGRRDIEITKSLNDGIKVHKTFSRKRGDKMINFIFEIMKKRN